jgi:hypothetical protein
VRCRTHREIVAEGWRTAWIPPQNGPAKLAASTTRGLQVWYAFADSKECS